jgi:hypothetical protein
LTLLQANVLVAMLGGFWARESDGHPGPYLLGRGLVELAVVVKWERMQKGPERSEGGGKDPPGSRRRRRRAKLRRKIPRPKTSSTTQFMV